MRLIIFYLKKQKRMTLERFKEVLAEEGKDLTEKQIIELKHSLEQMVELIFDDWLENQKKGII